MQIRKLYTIIDETRSVLGKELDEPIKKAAAVADIKNPHTETFVEDLSPFYEIGKELGVF